MSIGMAGILRSRDHEFTATKQRMVELAAENADLHREMKECRRIIGNTSVIVDVWDSTAVHAGLTAECATRRRPISFSSDDEMETVVQQEYKATVSQLNEPVPADVRPTGER